MRSAIDNANFLSSEKHLDLDVDNLYVKRAVANDGPRMKRIRPAPMGRAYRYVRRIAHIEIALAERGQDGQENRRPRSEEENKSKNKKKRTGRGVDKAANQPLGSKKGKAR